MPSTLIFYVAEQRKKIIFIVFTINAFVLLILGLVSSYSDDDSRPPILSSKVKKFKKLA